MTNVAILASYNGSGFQALYNSAKSLNINIPLIISNNTNANILQKAQKYNIDSFVVNAKNSELPDEKIKEIILKYKCEYIFLSGYMKKISPILINKFKIINCHPALLPKYGGKGMYGRFVHEAVIKNKEQYSGVTIHEVNENFDDGAIIFQDRLELYPKESVQSLEKRIKELEAIAIVKGFSLCLK